jgi:hypothetical protein
MKVRTDRQGKVCRAGGDQLVASMSIPGTWHENILNSTNSPEQFRQQLPITSCCVS